MSAKGPSSFCPESKQKAPIEGVEHWCFGPGAICFSAVLEQRGMSFGQGPGLALVTKAAGVRSYASCLISFLAGETRCIEAVSSATWQFWPGVGWFPFAVSGKQGNAQGERKLKGCWSL